MCGVIGLSLGILHSHTALIQFPLQRLCLLPHTAQSLHSVRLPILHSQDTIFHLRERRRESKRESNLGRKKGRGTKAEKWKRESKRGDSKGEKDRRERKGKVERDRIEGKKKKGTEGREGEKEKEKMRERIEGE